MGAGDLDRAVLCKVAQRGRLQGSGRSVGVWAAKLSKLCSVDRLDHPMVARPDGASTTSQALRPNVHWLQERC